MRGGKRINPITWIFLFHSNKSLFCDSKRWQLQCHFYVGAWSLWSAMHGLPCYVAREMLPHSTAW